jgi:hypothetical protein
MYRRRNCHSNATATPRRAPSTVTPEVEIERGMMILLPTQGHAEKHIADQLQEARQLTRPGVSPGQMTDTDRPALIEYEAYQ